jgi:hypothetical protein
LSDKVPKDAIGQLPELSSRKTSGTFIVAHNLRVIEARERQRAAEAAAERARERAVLRGAVVAKLREHVNFGSIDLDFAGSVEAWLEGQPANGAEHPRLALLREFSEGRLSAIRFHARWLEAAVAGPGAAPGAAPAHGIADSEPAARVEARTAAPRAEAKAGPRPAEAAAAPEAPREPEARRMVGPGVHPAPAAARGRRRWRVGLVGICYFGLLVGLEVLGFSGYQSAALPGAVAGALAWGLSARRRWPGFLASLAAVGIAESAFVALLIYEANLDEYLGDLVGNPEPHLMHLASGVSGFLAAWIVLAVLGRALRRGRPA